MHEDPVTKSKRVTDSTGGIVSRIELDPWGADTNRSSNAAFQPHKYTSYERDGNASDEAMFRRFNRYHSRFDQPDPYGGSYDFSDPQSLNRCAYTKNDPVNFTDPSGLDWDHDNAVWFQNMGFTAYAGVPYSQFGLAGHFTGPNVGFIRGCAEMQQAESDYAAWVRLAWLSLPRNTVSKPSRDDIARAINECLNTLWGAGIYLTSFLSSAAGKDGKASFTYYN